MSPRAVQNPCDAETEPAKSARPALPDPAPDAMLVEVKSKTIQCPTCKKRGDWFSGADGPFCSHRCKLIDLGKWLGEEHRISEPLRPDHLSGYENLPPGQDLDVPED